MDLNGKFDDVLLTPTPHTEASEVIRNKPVVTKEVYDRLSPELRAMAFTITGIESADVLQNVRDAIAKLPEGANWDDVKQDILKEIAPYFTPKGASRRAELLMRIHGLNAYRVGQWELAQETKDALPYFKYIATMDARTRPSHAALHGLVLPVDDPFWDKHMPPGWAWFCRCQVVQVAEYEVEEQRKAEKKLPLDQRRVLNETQLRELHEYGTLTVGPDKKINFNSKSEQPITSLKSLRFPKEEILQRYKTTEAKEEFLKNLENIPLDNYFGKPTVKDWFEDSALMIVKKNYFEMSFEDKLKEIDSILREFKKHSIKLKDNEMVSEIGKEIFTLPMSKQGQVLFANKLSKDALDIISVEKEEIEKFVNGKYLEGEVKVEIIDCVRSFYDNASKKITLKARHQKNIFSHEYMHFLEDSIPNIHHKCVEFLKKRAKGEDIKPLSFLTGNNKYRNEHAFEDSWVKKGGNAYSGKYYDGYKATEVLSMGIERFLENPLLFYKQDKEYFEFVVKTIQE